MTSADSGHVHDYPQRALEARKFAAIGELASGIAHEINTPTQYIGDNLRFLLDAFAQLVAVLPADAAADAAASTELEYLRAEIPSAVAQSLDGIAQITEIVSALRRFATATVGEVGMLDLNDAIESVLAIAHNEWKYVARVERDLDPALPRVPCTEAEVKQLILSLVLNAARAIAAGAAASGTQMALPGTIRVTTRVIGDAVVLSIGDTGTGLAEIAGEMRHETDATSASERARAFDFAREVAVEHRGTLRIESVVGQGTTVVVRLPLGAGVVEDEPALLADAASATGRPGARTADVV